MPSIVRMGDVCSGILLRRDLAVYAAHCGPVDEVWTGQQSHPVRACAFYPGWSLFGNDIAYCTLTDPIADIEPAIATLPCEAAQLGAGSEVDIFGYGFAEGDDQFGTLRQSSGVIKSVSNEVEIEGADLGPCGGDSGGPIIAHLQTASARADRVYGLVSAGGSGCKKSPVYASELAPYLGWLEANSLLDITPCGAKSGDWAPTSACTGTASNAKEATAWDGCGPAAPADSQTVQLDLASVVVEPQARATFLATNHGNVSVQVRAVLPDARQADLTFSIRDAENQERWHATQSFAPFEFEVSLPGDEADYVLSVEAKQQNGSVVSTSRTFSVRAAQAGGGCCFAPAREPPSLAWLFCLGALALTGQRIARKNCAC